MKHWYGKVALISGYCPGCDEECLGDAEGRCTTKHCRALLVERRGVRREMPSWFHRRRPSLAHQREQLERQAHRCYWCGERFGEFIISPTRRPRELKVTWDHFIPYSYTGSCDDLDFVAACQVCNGIKHADIFDTEDECRAYLLRRRRVLGWVRLEDAA